MIEYKDPFRMRHCARILGGQQFSGVHAQIADWIYTVPGAFFDTVRGVSYINGETFYHDVEFEREEDLLAFKLVYAGKVG